DAGRADEGGAPGEPNWMEDSDTIGRRDEERADSLPACLIVFARPAGIVRCEVSLTGRADNDAQIRVRAQTRDELSDQVHLLSRRSASGACSLRELWRLDIDELAGLAQG